MATLRKRNGRWQVQVRRSQQPGRSRTFTSKADAQAWARLEEHAIEIGDLPKRADWSVTLGDLLDRYARDVIPLKRADSTEDSMLRVLKRHPMSTKPIALLSPEDVADFRDSRLTQVKPATVVRQLRVLKHALRIARDEWGWRVPYAEVQRVRMPQVLIRHTDRIADEDLHRLLAAADRQDNLYVAKAIRLALATGMRRGELLALTSSDIDLVQRRARIRMSKNGLPRVVPLTPTACSLLADAVDGKVLPLTANCLKLGFARARRSAKTNFRFHDLRHEAISRFFELGLTIPEVQLISGHRTFSQLARYSHADVERVAGKLGS